MTETGGPATAVTDPEGRLAAPTGPFAALDQVFVDDGSYDDALRRVAQLGRRIGGADMAGVATIAGGKLQATASTDACAGAIEEMQCAHDEGPSVDAVQWMRACRFGGRPSHLRWPRFAAYAVDRSVASAMSLPVAARGEVLGALTLYSYQAQAFESAPSEKLTRFVGRAAVVIANSKLYWDARTLSENLTHAMRSRATIDCAIGILMANGGRTAAEAFHILVRASQRENRKLREIASDVVDRAPARRRPRPAEG